MAYTTDTARSEMVDRGHAATAAPGELYPAGRRHRVHFPRLGRVQDHRRSGAVPRTDPDLWVALGALLRDDRWTGALARVQRGALVLVGKRSCLGRPRHRGARGAPEGVAV